MSIKELKTYLVKYFLHLVRVPCGCPFPSRPVQSDKFTAFFSHDSWPSYVNDALLPLSP